MLSLILLFFLLLLCQLTCLAALIISSRKMHSSRTGFRCHLAVYGKMLLINLATSFMCGLISQVINLPNWVALLLLGLPLIVIFSHKIIAHHYELQKDKAVRVTASYFASICFWVALALLIVRPFLIEAYRVPTNGNAPTIEAGNRIFSNKLLTPKRFDFVTFHPPISPKDIYCQRIIGLPGERLKFQDGNLYVNDQLLQMPKVLAGKCYVSPSSGLANGINYLEGQTIVLKHDECFLIGDNTFNSYDSRCWGPAKYEQVEGAVDVLYLPQNKFRIFR